MNSDTRIALEDARFVVRLLENNELERAEQNAELMLRFIRSAIDSEGIVRTPRHFVNAGASND